MENLRDKAEKTIIKEYVSWQDIEDFIQFLADNSHNFKDFNGVYAPARGGLLFGIMISYKYDLPFLAAPQVGCLIVDDIVDSGDTAMAWKNKGYIVASMYYNDKLAKVRPNIYWRLKKDKWIVFPYEKQD